MDVLNKTIRILKRYPLCDHCLGRQYATLGHNMENNERGRIIKTALAIEAHILVAKQNEEGAATLKTLAVNGFLKMAEEILHKTRKHVPRKHTPKECFLCENRFQVVKELAEKALRQLEGYDYNNFLVGVKIP